MDIGQPLAGRESGRAVPPEPESTRDWIRTTHNRVKKRMQSLSLLHGGEGQDEGGRYHQL